MKTLSTHSLRDQSIVVIGGSDGIGLAVAELAHQAGANVTIIARNAERLKAAAANLGPKVDARVGDFDVEASLKAALAHLTRIDHVHIAAGSAEFAHPLADNAAEKFGGVARRVVGSMQAVQLIAPRMPPGGSFVFTGGISTDRPVSTAWGTSVATAAVEQLARTLSITLAPLRFNAIAPGWTDTPMWDALLGAEKASVFASVAEKIPVRRLATAAEVAEAILLLMRVSSITGEVLHVDGGQRLI
ncbi:MAG: SDR family oxidoreductase [Verrucomicrobia bacterium]|nr:SDR family oxidoreductase [Verrucomicrobiota bacterium]